MHSLVDTVNVRMCTISVTYNSQNICFEVSHFQIVRCMKLEKGDTVTEYVILFIWQILPKGFGLKDHVITSQKTCAFSKAL